MSENEHQLGIAASVHHLGLAIGEHAIAQAGEIVVGDNLLTIHADGTVDGRIEDAGEAARVFVEFVRQYVTFPDFPYAVAERGETIAKFRERSDASIFADRILADVIDPD
jgi:hypothetical protein